MKKFTKAISTLLVVALVVAMATVSAFAAEAESITVVSGPDKTVYYDGLDSYENEIWCDPTGMVLEVTFDDGSTETITVDEYSYVDMYVVDYVIGENEAVVEFYGTDDYDTYLETTYTVTVEESPVASVEVTKMPAKTEYDMETDVLTRDNFTLDYLYESDPEAIDEMLADIEKDVVDFIGKSVLVLVQLHLHGGVGCLLKLKSVVKDNNILRVVCVHISPCGFECVDFVLTQPSLCLEESSLVATALDKAKLIDESIIGRLKSLGNLDSHSDTACSVLCVPQQFDELPRLELLSLHQNHKVLVDRLEILQHRDVKVLDIKQSGHIVPVSLYVAISTLAEQIILNHCLFHLESIQSVTSVTV